MDNEWIPHKPGDPMPVDGGTLVELQFSDGAQSESLRPADEWNWTDRPTRKITAYRIHKKEREMKYKAGDKITIVLDEYNAGQLNRKSAVSNLEIEKETKVIAYEPAPEPVVGYLYYSKRNNQFMYGRAVPGDAQVIKCHFNPATKEVKAEVVG